MPSIFIATPQLEDRADVLALLRERGFDLIFPTSHTGEDLPADLALADITGTSITDELGPALTQNLPDDVPVLVLADTPPVLVHDRIIAGWLTMPAEDMEIVGAVTATVNARAAMNGQGDLAALHAKLLEIQRERDMFESADQKKDEFISYISHELKNPMASIKGYSDLMRRRLNKAPEDPNRKGLEIISAQVGRMTMLLDQLLDFSRISMDRLQLDIRPTNLARLVERVVEETQPMTNRHALQLVLDDEAIVGLVDENRLRQGLQYLLNNAIKFSPEPGTIVVTVQRDREGYGCISISDKGIGIPKADQQRIFERFIRASNVDEHQSGLGLGLYLAYEIVARHSGQISVESEERRGSTFTVTLPLAPAE